MPIATTRVSVSFDVDAKVEKTNAALPHYICREADGITWDALDAKIKKEERDQGKPEVGLYEGLVADISQEKSVEKFIKLGMLRVP